MNESINKQESNAYETDNIMIDIQNPLTVAQR